MSTSLSRIQVWNKLGLCFELKIIEKGLGQYVPRRNELPKEGLKVLCRMYEEFQEYLKIYWAVLSL